MNKYHKYIKLKTMLSIYNTLNNNHALYSIFHHNIDKNFKNDKINLFLKTNNIKKIGINGPIKKMFKNNLFFNLLKGPTCVLFFKNLKNFKYFFSIEFIQRQFIPLACVVGYKFYFPNLIINYTSNNIEVFEQSILLLLHYLMYLVTKWSISRITNSFTQNELNFVYYVRSMVEKKKLKKN